MERKKRVLVVSNLPIASKMSGPSIRMINIANILNNRFDTKLYSTHIEESQFSNYAFLSRNTFFHEILKADYVYSQPSRFRFLFLSRMFKKKIIIDLYDPTDIENLEMYKGKTDLKSKLRRTYSNLRLKYAMKIADYFVCANEIQKSYWIGYIQSLGLLKKDIYMTDNTLSNFIGLLPYGIDHIVPSTSFNPYIEKFHFSSDTKVLVWAGGIWNWFDTETLIYAMKKLENYENIKLVFLGVPSKYERKNPKYEKLTKTIELAKREKIYNKNVFFNDEWIDYDKRHNYLLNSYMGVSTHFDNLETTFSFRTRILDFIWCELPFVTSAGDYFSDLCHKHEIGCSVSCCDAEELAKAILEIVQNETKYKKIKNNIRKQKEEFYWENTCQDLVHYIEKNQSHVKPRFITSTLFLMFVPIKLIWLAFRGE